MNTLIHCIYASTATAAFREFEIPGLLEEARARNGQIGVTGMLLYVEGSFFQVLEGASAQVDPLFERIARDPRHARVTRIIHEPIASRSFADWTMGFSTLALHEAAELTGENDFFRDASCMLSLGGGRAKRLLAAFRSGRWRTEHTGMFRAPGRVA